MCVCVLLVFTSFFVFFVLFLNVLGGPNEFLLGATSGKSAIRTDNIRDFI